MCTTYFVHGEWAWKLFIIHATSRNPVLLVVLAFIVEELLQDLSEGLNLVLRDALLELIRSAELLVELLR